MRCVAIVSFPFARLRGMDSSIDESDLGLLSRRRTSLEVEREGNRKRSPFLLLFVFFSPLFSSILPCASYRFSCSKNEEKIKARTNRCFHIHPIHYKKSDNEPLITSIKMRRDDLLNQPSDIHNQGQGTNFLKDVILQVKNMAQGATDIGKGAAQGAMNLARGTATGAANIAFGATDAMKNTLGMNPADNTGPINCPGNMGSALMGWTVQSWDSRQDVEHNYHVEDKPPN
ncbi:Hypothetical predicted protein [Olea europaea subsp. europaea]|uniref:Uncharacterized protein n=1 Tax=Olea europaea subsp. europaea TaxID=158383 RepID=A0A8S0SV03_OLEEU|nr:Hypothetical predicted protein [Olea europaea subsp. europaea]